LPNGSGQLGDIRHDPPRLVVGSLSPTQKGFIKKVITNLTLLDRYYCAATIAIDDRNVEPGSIPEKLDVLLHVIGV
jgi:hypothetical protein